MTAQPGPGGAEAEPNPAATALAAAAARARALCAELADADLDADFIALGRALEQASRLLDEHPEPLERWLALPRHDLRNALGALIGYAELIEEALPPGHAGATALHHIQALSRELLERLQSQRALPGTESAHSGESEAPPPGRVLVIDDNPDSRALLARYLEQLGHRVEQAPSAEAALKQLEGGHIDLILLDLLMPDISGYEMLLRLKQHPQWRSIPVVMVSGMQDTAKVIPCIESGAEDYLVKPVNRVLLNARVANCLERKRWHDREQAYQRELEKNQRFIRQTFGRYLSEEIVASLLEQPGGLELGGDRRKVTLLMCDIRGFTRIGEQLPPERVVALLNNYLGAMSDVIMHFGGTVDEFIGDAILAIFGAPVAREDDSARAIACAVAMQREMLRVNARNQALGLPVVRIGIGLNTGEVIAGNIGSEKRAKYGVVGHHVNLTSRIESYTEGGDILASAATVADAGAPLQLGEARLVQPKGIEGSQRIYPVLGIGAPFNLSLEDAAAP